VIMVQVLSTEVANRTKEYAVLKAMGAAPWFVHGIAAAQAVLLGLGGLLPALVLGGAVLWYIEFRTHLETALGLTLFAKMLAIACVTALCAAMTVVMRVQRADPAALY
jgi:putative ABC transport system permease protein